MLVERCVCDAAAAVRSVNVRTTVPTRPCTDDTGDFDATAELKSLMSVEVRTTVPVLPATLDTGPYLAATEAKSLMSVDVRTTVPVRPATLDTGPYFAATEAKSLISTEVRTTVPVLPATLRTGTLRPSIRKTPALVVTVMFAPAATASSGSPLSIAAPTATLTGDVPPVTVTLMSVMVRSLSMCLRERF